MGNKKIPEVSFSGFDKEWKVEKLGDLVSIKSGWSPSNFNETHNKKGSLFIKVDDLNYSSREQMNSRMKVEDTQRFMKMKKGSTIFPKRGAAIMTNKIRILGLDAYMDTNMMALEPLSINGEFLYTFISKTGLYKIADTSTLPQINNKHIEPYIIFLPTEKEQKKVGEFFKTLDKIITLHQQELTTLKQTKQGFLQKMFPKEGETVPEVRFPKFSGEWENRTLDQVFKEFIVPMRDKPKEFSGDIPWTRIEDIEGRYINGTKSGQYVSKETIDLMKLRIIPKGSLIVSASATFGIVAIVNNDLITNQTFIGLVPNTNNNIEFLYAFFKSASITKKLKRESAGSIIFYISRKQFENLDGSFPGFEEQTQIGNFFKQLDDTISLHEQELEALKQTKQAFLQKMFV
ncbi:restriction endonuclease subunit S [Sporosarcina sp. BI001-red]|uniref:restriction endonuclease subunit S n=1 Tax=Sporosarcina sp. BI001-red TaxID=2282866 RepID=UPI000E232736|nr:restriction endonuclease subunit S [Sporosarcina sp. BI001-red]REB11594.1 restriction endonuclease subunit S [Sporosarcina sp. BI001-red]